ncbi:MAG: GBS Bsp-like repeat-containing protein [Beduini sp.]|uniref:GBS Bsp-like repeat-containing protein n=1 Tax=Beduini sp. TaxID=1922300 RepID=UPI0039A0E95E
MIKYEGKSATFNYEVRENIDNQKLSISNVQIIKKYGKYTITAKISSDIAKVSFPTWSEANGQDDIVWHQGSIVNGIATCRITIDSHNYEYGDYITHIYLYDEAGLITTGEIYQKLLPASSNPGWEVQNGKKYLFDNEGNFVEKSRYFIIDVSEWQGNID